MPTEWVDYMTEAMKSNAPGVKLVGGEWDGVWGGVVIYVVVVGCG